MESRVRLVQRVPELLVFGLPEETDKRIEETGQFRTVKGLDSVAVGKVADDQPQNTFAVARVTGISVNPQFLGTLTALVIGAISDFQVTGLSQSFGHPVEESFHREYATCIRFAADIGHQVLMIFVEFAHD